MTCWTKRCAQRSYRPLSLGLVGILELWQPFQIQASRHLCVSLCWCVCVSLHGESRLFLSWGVTELERLDDMIKLQHRKFRLDRRKNFFLRYLEKRQISFLWDFQSLPKKSHSWTNVFKQQGGWHLQFCSFQKFYNSTKSEHWNLCLLFLFKIKIILNQTPRLQRVRKQTNKAPSK